MDSDDDSDCELLAAGPPLRRAGSNGNGIIVRAVGHGPSAIGQHAEPVVPAVLREQVVDRHPQNPEPVKFDPPAKRARELEKQRIPTLVENSTSSTVSSPSLVSQPLGANVIRGDAGRRVGPCGDAGSSGGVSGKTDDVEVVSAVLRGQVVDRQPQNTEPAKFYPPSDAILRHIYRGTAIPPACSASSSRPVGDRPFNGGGGFSTTTTAVCASAPARTTSTANDRGFGTPDPLSSETDRSGSTTLRGMFRERKALKSSAGGANVQSSTSAGGSSGIKSSGRCSTDSSLQSLLEKVGVSVAVARDIDAASSAEESGRGRWRSIIWNLRRNKQLLADVNSGATNWADLLVLSADDLAGQELRQKREKLREEALKDTLVKEDRGFAVCCPACGCAEASGEMRHFGSGPSDINDSWGQSCLHGNCRQCGHVWVDGRD
eukprot:TRINITY_DN19502_c0_g1_i2.p1 TRINITY_DN19502_c0_g1~~TRINITY_DN19502_c0_g1_i2.p1  ORF type:complete len:433 (-),score=58.31 TRINITY_DN19502_c0_g1_i2:33-1331(-)